MHLLQDGRLTLLPSLPTNTAQEVVRPGCLAGRWYRRDAQPPRVDDRPKVLGACARPRDCCAAGGRGAWASAQPWSGWTARWTALGSLLPLGSSTARASECNQFRLPIVVTVQDTQLPNAWIACPCSLACAGGRCPWKPAVGREEGEGHRCHCRRQLWRHDRDHDHHRGHQQLRACGGRGMAGTKSPAK